MKRLLILLLLCSGIALADSAVNVLSGVVDLSSITRFTVPVSAGATATVNGSIKYDSTNNMLHGAQGGADAMIPQFTVTPVNAHCATWVVVGSQYKLGDAACSGGGTVTVVGGGSLTNTAFVTGGGTTTVQTPSATSTLDASGNANFAGTVSTTGLNVGTTPPSVTPGTGGVWGAKEGTAPSVCAAAGVDCIYADSTSHAFLFSLNNGAYQAPVLVNQTNTGGASMTLNMSASTSANAHVVPNVAGASTTTNGAIAYDTTNKNGHIGLNGADNIIGVITAAPTNGNCASWSVSAGAVKLADAGAACGGSGSATAMDYTKHWEYSFVSRWGDTNLGLSYTRTAALGAQQLWATFSGTPTFNNRAADSNFNFFIQMAPTAGGNMAGSSGGFGAKEYYRTANTLMHVRLEPNTGTNARYTAGFSDCSIATIVASDNPTCNNAYLLASTTTGTSNWYCVVGNGVTSAATSTGVAWVAGTAYELQVNLNSGDVTCTVNGTATTVSTNLPGTGTSMYGGYITVAATSGAATTTVRWDKLYLQMDN